MTDLPSLGVNATRIEQLRDNMLTKLEALVENYDTEGEAEPNAQRADAIHALSEAFVDLR